MIEIMVVLILACVAMVISGYFALKPVVIAEKRRFCKVEREELAKIISESAKLMRNCEESGNGIAFAPFFRSVCKVNKIITKKARKKHMLTESEIWFYENYYLVYRTVFSSQDSMKKLPHFEGIPRIVRLARLICDNSLDDLTHSRVIYLMETIRKVIPLTFAEVRAFNYALAYAVVEQIFILSQRLEYHDKCKKMASNGYFNPKHKEKDVYLYYLYVNKNLKADSLLEMKKLGIDKNTVMLSYNDVLTKNTNMARTLFEALREINSYLPLHFGIRYLGSYQELSSYCDLKKYNENTLYDYFAQIEKIALKLKLSETYVASKLVEFAKFNGKDVSIILFDYYGEFCKFLKIEKLFKIKEKNDKYEYVYVFSNIALTVLASIGFGILLKNAIVGILAFIPLIFIVDNFVNYVLSHLNVGINPPQMNFDRIPYQYSTMVVISEFISSVKQLEDSIFNARVIYGGNEDDNLSVALLVDTKGDNQAVSTLDMEIIDYLKNNDLGKGINVFLRKKTFDGKKFIAKERKRGAIMALNKLLLNRDEFEFLYVYDKNYVTPELVVTLDADNTLVVGEIKRMVNMMAHPYNQKYDLLSMQSRNSLYSLDTYYSMRFLTDSGYEGYPYYTSLYYKMFKKDLFCGKGIYRLKAFYNKLEDVFPSKKILSHDILEGSILNTGCGGTCFEDAPKSFLSDRERKKRWQRGDIQLLPFIFGAWKNDNKKQYKCIISPLYKYVMLKNVLSCVKELCLATLLLYGLIVSNQILYVGLALFGLPYLINEIKILRGQVHKLKLSYILKSSYKNFLTLIEDFFTLAYYSVSNSIILVSTLGRMFFNGNLLEWRTYYSSQKTNGLAGYVRELAIPLSVWTIIICALGIFRYSVTFAYVYLIGLCLVFIELYLTSRRISRKEMSNSDKEKLQKIAESTYKYFVYMKENNAIIGDNLQIKPYKGISKNTSPTNIGFSLIAEICAYYLGFITIDDCIFNIEEIINSIKKLPKWHGLLYNWYDVKTLKNVNSFISSVDNGNFLAAILTCREFLKQNSTSIATLKIDLLIKEFDLKRLYDDKNNLFYIGFDGSSYMGKYDLLASEARILSTLFIAIYNNDRHYACLKKDYTSLGGNTLLSWSGTMFEMLMPDIFFPTPRESLISKSIFNTVKKQIKNKIRGLWGISESGRYLFDDQLYYQYYAFGVSELALCSKDTGAVISPYASILALNYKPREVIKNLDLMIERGLLFEYGFYESVDFSKGEHVVKSVMSHHQGMILASITNFLCNNQLQKLMQGLPKIKATLNYYNELQPKFKFGSKNGEKQRKYNNINETYYKYFDKLEYNLQCAGLSDTEYSLICNSFGGSISRFRDIFINKSTCDFEQNEGYFFYAKNSNNQWVSPTFLPYGRDVDDYDFSYSSREIFHTKKSAFLSQSVTIVNGLNGEIRKLRCDYNYTKCAFYGEPILETLDGYASHPTFNAMFFTSKIVNDNVIIFEKNMRGNKDKFRYLGVRVEGLINLKFETNRMNFIGRNGSEFFPIIFESDNTDYSSVGDVLAPCIGFIGEFNSGYSRECQVGIFYGESEEELLRTISTIPNDMYSYALNLNRTLELSERVNEYLGTLLYMPYPKAILENVQQSGKINKFNSFANGKITLRYEFDKNGEKQFIKFLENISNLRIFNIFVKLCIILKNSYSEDLKKYVISSLNEKLIFDYILIEKDSEEKYWCYAKIDENGKLIYAGNYQLSPVFFAKRNCLRYDNDIQVRDLVFATGAGGYNSEGDYVVYGDTRLPYSHVIALKDGGLIATSDGGGYFYFKNSRENKMVYFDNDFVAPTGGEYLFLKTALGYTNILGGEGKNRYSIVQKGRFLHVVDTNSFYSEVAQGVIFGGKIKYTEIKIKRKETSFKELLWGIKPALGWKYDPIMVTFAQNNDIISIQNLKNGIELYVKLVGINFDNMSGLVENSKDVTLEYYLDKDFEKITFLYSQDVSLLRSLNPDNLSVMYNDARKYFEEFFDIRVNSPQKSFDYLINFLPYQVLSSRINARAGFYQVGGAIGFRDQLQDSLAFFYKPHVMEERIIECCLHQYQEGDVMHWWHEPKFGLRTRITDDKLFLVLAICEYIKYTGDTEILNKKLPYLKSEPLANGTMDRLENPEYTDYEESIFKHALRAIRASLKYGVHKLLILGTGDWNDGIDYVGKENRGESVFNSMLCYKVLIEFSEYCPSDLKEELQKIAFELKSSINLHAWEEDRYKRLFTDDGRWLGSKRSETLRIDLLVQAFAVISGVAEGERAIICLESASKLVDKETGIIKLLSPCQTRKDYLGYISDYPQGIRENGGQYTHATIWYLIALCMVGKQDYAYELFCMINPVEKCADSKINNTYMGEPYVLSGDVYSNQDNKGRMGWSWYTGSAGWAYKLAMEYFFGIKKRGEYLYFEPTLPKRLDGSRVTYKFGSVRYEIEYRFALTNKILLDGERVEKVKLEDNVDRSVIVEIGM